MKFIQGEFALTIRSVFTDSLLQQRKHSLYSLGDSWNFAVTISQRSPPSEQYEITE